MTPRPAATIADTLAGFLHAGLALTVASRDADNLPEASRALGVHFTADQQRLVVVLSRSQARRLLGNVKANGHVALVCTEPSTHRALQVKGRDGVVEEQAGPSELQRVAIHREGFLAEVVPLGYPEPLIRTFMACPDDDLAAITFTPVEAYVQTPGLSAGDPVPEGA